MAIPDNPLFDKATLAAYDARLRSLALPARAKAEIAAYLAVPLSTVEDWLYPHAFKSGVVTRTRTVRVRVPVTRRRQTTRVLPWAKDHKKHELLSVLGYSTKTKTVAKKRVTGTGITQRELAKYFKQHSSTKKEKLVLLAAKLTHAQLGGLFDTLRPRTETAWEDYPDTEERDEEETYQVQLPRRRLPDMLPEEDYRNRLLSVFPRGHYLRRKADLALALLGEVTQTPQDGVEPASYRERTGGAHMMPARALYEMEELHIWPHRQGKCKDDFLSEMWFKITLRFTAPDFSGGAGYWDIIVDYYRVYEAVDLVHTTGWPTRAAIKGGKRRTETEIEDVLKRKAEWDAWQKRQAQKKRQKAKANKRKK